MTISKKNDKVKTAIIANISEHGYTPDRYGNYLNANKSRRYKFNTTSYRFEAAIDTIPKEWVRLSGEYYKNLAVNGEIPKLLKF